MSFPFCESLDVLVLRADAETEGDAEMDCFLEQGAGLGELELETRISVFLNVFFT